MDLPMKFAGAHEAWIDDKGRVVFPSAYRRWWPTPRLWATKEISDNGTYIVCIPHNVLPERYSDYRARSIEHQLLRQGVNAHEAHQQGQEYKRSLSYQLLSMDKQCRIQMGALVREARLSNPLVWISLPAGLLDSIDGVELWQKDQLDALVERVKKESGPLLARILGPA